MNLRYNDKNLCNIMNMNDDEFTDYMIKEYNKKPSNSEIIMNSGMTIENLIKEINNYQDKIAFLAYKYEIPLNNKAAFIRKLCNEKEHIHELMPLLACFICRTDYLFELRNKKVSIKNEGMIAEYLLLKDDINNFETNVKNIYLNKKKYIYSLKNIKKSNNNIGENISVKDEKLLIKLYKQYIQIKSKYYVKNLIEEENKRISENIEQIHDFATETNERQKLYPFIIFQFFIHYKIKITKEIGLLNDNVITKYKKYTINRNNGKNYNTYENYIYLFQNLIDYFEDKCDVSLCMYAFEKASNLAEWVYKIVQNKSIFHYTIDSLIESTYGSTFYEQSLFWTENNLKVINYYDFELKNEGNKNSNGEYLSELVRSRLSDNDALDYLNEYSKGRRYAAKFIKNIAYNFFEMNNYKLKNVHDESYVFLMFERKMQERADNIIKQNIIELLE